MYQHLLSSHPSSSLSCSINRGLGNRRGAVAYCSGDRSTTSRYQESRLLLFSCDKSSFMQRGLIPSKQKMCAVVEATLSISIIVYASAMAGDLPQFRQRLQVVSAIVIICSVEQYDFLSYCTPLFGSKVSPPSIHLESGPAWMLRLDVGQLQGAASEN